MVSKPNTSNSLKSLYITTIVIAVLAISVVVGYWFLNQTSLAKTQPYNISLEVEAKEPSRLTVYYDYGFGFNKYHQQTFILLGDQPESISFTVSAWKTLHSLRVDTNTVFTLNSVLIKKLDAEYQALESTQVVRQNSPHKVMDIQSRLAGIR